MLALRALFIRTRLQSAPVHSTTEATEEENGMNQSWRRTRVGSLATSVVTPAVSEADFSKSLR